MPNIKRSFSSNLMDGFSKLGEIYLFFKKKFNSNQLFLLSKKKTMLPSIINYS
jgi:hypothetical protein